MDVDIHLARRQFQKQQHHRIHRRRNDVAVGLGQSVLDEAVANQPAVDEDENRIAIQLLDFGLRNEAVKAHLAGICGSGGITFFVFVLAPPGRRLRHAHVLKWLHSRHSNQLVEGFFAEDLINAFAVARHRRGDQHGVSGGMQFEMLFGMRQSIVRDQ